VTATLTCPRCRRTTEEAVPQDSCLFFWQCGHCGETIRPEPGDCCVFCSYGSVKCPPIQRQRSCCE